MGGGSSEPEKEQKQNQQAQNNDKKLTMKTKNISLGRSINQPKKRQQQKIKNLKKQISQEENTNEDIADSSLNLKLPLCNNKRKATHICLHQKCTKYPFFCLQCEYLCEENHHHGKSLSSVSFKEFQKRLARAKTTNRELQQAEGSYKQTLLMFSQNFDDFYDCQLGLLEEIEIKKSLSSEALILKAKIEKNQKSDLTGKNIHELWTQAAQWPEEEGQILVFLRKKEQLMVNLLETFQNINKTNKTATNKSSNKKKDKKTTSPSESQLKEVNDKKTIHLFNRYEIDSQNIEIYKEKNWSSGKFANKKC